jgi:hypothetical protein
MMGGYICINSDAQSTGPPELERPQHNHTTADPRSSSRSHAHGSLGSMGLLVSRSRALVPRCARLLLAAHGYSQLLDAARTARYHPGGPRYARLLVLLGWAKHIALVSRCCLLVAARCCSWLLAASRRPASTRPQVARPDERTAHASLHLTRAYAWSGFVAHSWSQCSAGAYVGADLHM